MKPLERAIVFTTSDEPQDGPSAYATVADVYGDQGVSVIPCAPGDKFPGEFGFGKWSPANDWTKYCDRLPTSFETDVWDRWPDAGVCLMLGSSSAPPGKILVAVDIDTDEAAEIEAIKRVLPGSPCAKRGRKGETQFYLAKPCVVNRSYNDGKRRRMLDLLCDGRQTVMPPTIHQSGVPYRWVTPDTLESFDVKDLPVLPDDIGDRLAEALKPFGYDAPVQLGGPGSASLDGEKVHRALNDAALANLDAWVPALSLYNCVRTGDRYRAVASWRPSSTGQPEAKRKRNLSIAPGGIKDFGDDQTYTPLDLVRAAFFCELEQAFRWLQERVTPARPALAMQEPTTAAVKSPRGNLAHLSRAVSDGARVIADSALGRGDDHEAAQLQELDSAAVAQRYEEARRVLRECAPLMNLPSPEECMEADLAGADPQLPQSDCTLRDLVHPPGLVGKLIDWMEASAERPNRPLYIAAALTFVGTLAGRKFASRTDLRTNQYFVTLAPSGHGKDHPIRKIKLLAEAAGLDRYVGPARIMSASALRNLIKREPAVACYIDEFAGVLRQIHDRRAGLHNQMIKHDLLDLFSSAWTSFSGAEYAGEAATKVMAPNLSLSGTSTPDDFWASLTSMSTMDGLLARFILINVTGAKSPRRQPTIGAREVPLHLITACRELAEAGQRTNLGGATGNAPEPVVVHFDGPGAEALERFTSEMDAAEEGSASPLTRVREHAIKLALTVAVGVNATAPVITAPVFEWASRLALLSATTLVREARDRIADNEREAAYNKMLGLIRKAGKDGVTEGVIRDRCRGVDKRVREQIIEDLIVSGRVRRAKVETGLPGRPAERLVAA